MPTHPTYSTGIPHIPHQDTPYKLPQPKRYYLLHAIGGLVIDYSTRTAPTAAIPSCFPILARPPSPYIYPSICCTGTIQPYSVSYGVRPPPLSVPHHWQQSRPWVATVDRLRNVDCFHLFSLFFSTVQSKFSYHLNYTVFSSELPTHGDISVRTLCQPFSCTPYMMLSVLYNL